MAHHVLNSEHYEEKKSLKLVTQVTEKLFGANEYLGIIIKYKLVNYDPGNNPSLFIYIEDKSSMLGKI